MAGKDAVSEFADIFNSAAIKRSWPAPIEQAPWSDALRLAGFAKVASELDGCAKAAAACQRMTGYPIVGVLGQLNAGKSSVVASFLSASGQDRLPRGLHDAQGTHRFVYWLPEAWRNEPAVWESFRSLLEAAHGPQIEYLDEDPTSAAIQYSSGLGKPSIIRCPLIAFDQALNDQGFALLDCPDVQTRDEGVPQLTAAMNPRVAFVCEAAKVCSAFLYVWEASKLNDALFADLLQGIHERTPAVPIFLLVNKIKPVQDEPTRTRGSRAIREAIDQLGISPGAVYGAFDHDVHSRTDAKGHVQPGWTDLTPPLLVERHQHGGGHPQFFSLSLNAAENVPSAVDRSRLLHVALPALPPAELQRFHLTAMIRTIGRLSRLAVTHVRDFIRERTGMIETRQSILLDAVVDIFTDRKTKQPTQLPDPKVLSAVRKSMTDTAPLPIRVVLRAKSWTGVFVTGPLRKGAGSVYRAASSVSGILNVRNSGEKAVKETLDGFKHLLVERHSSRDLARSLMAQRWFPAGFEEEQVTAAVNEAYSTVAAYVHQNPRVPPKEVLDRQARSMWRQISTLNSVRIFVFALLGVLGDIISLGGIALVVVDGGASLLGTLTIANVISTQLAACGILGGQVLAFLGAFGSSLAEINTIPSVSRLFAKLCDVFGVPRPHDFGVLQVVFGPSDKQVRFHLVDPDIEITPAVCPLGDQSLWREEPSVEQLARWAVAHG